MKSLAVSRPTESARSCFPIGDCNARLGHPKYPHLQQLGLAAAAALILTNRSSTVPLSKSDFTSQV